MLKSKQSMATALALCLAMAYAGLTPAAAATEAPTWRPVASEKLVKLPANYLRKSLDHDFAKSALAAAIGDTEAEIGLKGQTLGDLRAAIEQSDGELGIELRHQLLAQKREFITLMKKKSELRRQHLQTRHKILEGLMDKLGREQGEMTPARARLVAAQEGARERFRASVAKVDLAVLSSPAVPESKYARQYATNLAAVESLVAAIERHSANAQPMMGGVPASKQDFVRQMLADTQAGLAILDQERSIIGYMAKLVALDAMALSEQVMDADLADSDIPRTAGPAEAVRYFVN
ncbi:MAG: hypothetical protein QF578_12695 [Alphaproteobacteria bacterium]|nr:hypothetical protein [Alphaproteobacteria bacterium]